jgi:hypothetical protein
MAGAKGHPRGDVVALAVAAGCVAALVGLLAGCGSRGAEPTAQPVADPLLTRDVPAVVRRDCERAAHRLTEGAVYCPPLVPRGATRSQNRSSRGRFSTVAHDGEYVLNFVSPTLGGVDSAQPAGFRRHLGHWLVAAYEGGTDLTTGPGARVLRRLEVEGIEVTLAERRWVAYDLDAGHRFATWELEGRNYEVSLHGFEHPRALLDMARALVRQMRGCPLDGPTGPGAEPPCELVFASA